MHFDQLKVSTRLAIAFGLMIVLITVGIGMGIARLANLHDSVRDLATNRLNRLVIGEEWIVRVLETARHTRNMLILEDKDAIKKEVDATFEDKAKRKEYMEALQGNIEDEKGKALLQAVVDARATYTPHEDEYLRLVQAGQMKEAKTLLLEQTRPTQLAYVAALYKFNDWQRGDIDKQRSDGEVRFENGRNVLIAIGFLALIFSVVAAWFMGRSLVKQLGGEPAEVADIVRRVESGDLGVRIDLRPGLENSLLGSMQAMVTRLTGVIGAIRSASESISAASRQIATGNQDLSSRTEEQASSLEETASSIEEFTSTVKQNAQSAQQASELAAAASGKAQQGGETMNSVISTMQAIAQSSERIRDIITVIDGIAFQTNILALNAAVEAARAGEQGRGFAVVAAEVRNLAQRSASAAKEIKDLITASVSSVQTGSDLVSHAGVQMTEIVEAVKRVTDIIGEIAAASNEQSSGIDQVSQAIGQMDRVTQQNAALVEEAAAAAESLQGQTEDLVRATSVFKVAAEADRAGRSGSTLGTAPSRVPVSSSAPLPPRRSSGSSATTDQRAARPRRAA